jgi:lipopolysaccharide transport system ATP-binding protein
MPDNDVIIRAESIGKRYVLNHQAGGTGYRKFSDVLVHAAKAPLRWLRPSTLNSQLSTQREDFWALKDINFEIKRCEVVGIIGRNGAGKSTLLKILSRITEPTTGRITLKGRVASLLEVGTGFHPELTGRENIFLNGAILGMRRDEIKAKFDEIVAFAEIEKFLDTPVKRYSSGMYVRLAFAVAAHLEPEILIVDEVLAVGDAQFQAKCLGKMQDVARGGGRTVLFVSHNMGAVRSLCHTGIMLSQGQVSAHGDMEQVIGSYLKSSSSSKAFRVTRNENSYLTGCEVRVPGQPASESFFTSDAIEVVIRYRNERRINGLRVGFNIAQADGTILIGCTPEDEGSQTAIEPGEHEAIGRLAPNHLLKGAHQINASVWNGIDGTIYNELRSIYPFTMEAARERAYAVDTYRPGVLQVPVDWHIRSL